MQVDPRKQDAPEAGEQVADSVRVLRDLHWIKRSSGSRPRHRPVTAPAEMPSRPPGIVERPKD